MNAGLRAQAGVPLGLSWGPSVLNLFWKQRKKPESYCGQTRRDFTAKYTHLGPQAQPWNQSPTMPCPPQALSLPQCRRLPLEPAPLKPLEWSTSIWGAGTVYEGRTTQATSGTHCLSCCHSLAPSCRIHQASWNTSVLCCNIGLHLVMACPACYGTVLSVSINCVQVFLHALQLSEALSPGSTWSP